MRIITEKVTIHSPTDSSIDKAAEIIKKGGLVAFPTETVYGLGANAFDEKAVKKIYTAKGRPADNPLILHISNKTQITSVAKSINKEIEKIIDKFWPGPLTLILNKNNKIPKEVTSGLETVAIRMPKSNIALSLIEKSGVPIAAPSANISGKPSATSAEHVELDLNGKVDMILDGGITELGVESTILDMSGNIPVLLRPGSITIEQLEELIGEIIIDPLTYKKPVENTIIKSPGLKYTHYSPNAKMFMIDGDINDVAAEINKLISQQPDKKIGVLATEQTKHLYNSGTILVAGDREKPETIAKRLYSCLREFDKLKIDIIYSESFNTAQIGHAIMNRLRKAAGYNIIKVKTSKKKIIFVCTGNTCRSPMALYLAKHIFKETGIDAKIESRGTSVYYPSQASPNSIEALKEYNIELKEHTSQQITKEDMENADLILTMTALHKNHLKQLNNKNTIYTLNEYVGIQEKDIEDPYGGSLILYKKCAEQIKQSIELLAKKLKEDNDGNNQAIF